MKLLTRNTDYAARALSFIAKQNGRVVSVSRIERELNIPRPYLRKILQILSKRGLLESHKGPGGGFVLVAPADKIFLVDLIETFQGPIKLNACIFKKKICPDVSACLLKNKLASIERRVVSELKAITLASLMR